MKKFIRFISIFFCILLSSQIVHAEEIVEQIDLQEDIEVSQFTANDVSAEDYIKQCMFNKETRIDVSAYDLTTEDLSNIYADIINYTPELFYISNRYSVTINSTTRKVKTIQKFYYYAKSDYSADVATINAKQAEINAALNVIKSGVSSKQSNFEKLLYVHDYLIEHIEYDYSSILSQQSTVTYPKTDFDMYGALVLGNCVCQGYSHAFKYVCEQLGIGECGFASTANHIWNQVKLGSYYYNVDCTYDDYTYDIIMKASHANFLKSDAVFTQSHGAFTGSFACNSYSYDSISLNNIYTHLHYINGKYYYILDGYLRTLTIDSFGTIVYDKDALALPDCWAYSNCYFYNNNYVFYNTKTSVRLYNLTTNTYYDFGLTGKNIFGVYCDNTYVYYSYRHGVIVSNNTKESIIKLPIPADAFTKATQNSSVSQNTSNNSKGNPVKSVKLSRSSASIPVNSILYLGMKFYPEDADNVELITWSSSNRAIATVNSKGKVTAKSTGIVKITCKINNKYSATCVITVFKTGLFKSGSKLFYYDKNGKRVKNKWKTINGKKYYFGKKYYAVTGWQTIKKNKYYFNSSGVMQTKWKTIKGKKYYFGKNGKMRKGWVTIGKYKYYFTKNGVYKKKKKR